MGGTRIRGPDFLFGRLSVDQTSNINNGDHLKFDFVVQSNGSQIFLDTETPYTTDINVDSIGRITLKENKIFVLRASAIDDLGGSATVIAWRNADTGEILGGEFAIKGAPNITTGNSLFTVYDPKVDTRVELAIIDGGPPTMFSKNECTILINEISTPV